MAAAYRLEGSAHCGQLEYYPPEVAWNMQEQLEDIFSRCRGERSELIPILQDVQGAFGYIPAEAMKAVARFLNLPESVVYGVVTFYTQFHLTRQGKHKISVCQGTACHVRGSGRIMQAVKKSLGIRPGETTEDYMFSLERVACFGSCALAPVMVVDGSVHGKMTPQKAEALLESIE